MACSYYHTSKPCWLPALCGQASCANRQVAISVLVLVVASVVATDSDRVFSFGRGDYGQLGHGDTLDRPYPTAVEDLTGRGVHGLAAGQYHSVATLSDGGILTWGKNDYGQLGVSCTDPRLRPGLVAAPIEALTVAVSVACGCVGHPLAYPLACPCLGWLMRRTALVGVGGFMQVLPHSGDRDGWHPLELRPKRLWSAGPGPSGERVEAAGRQEHRGRGAGGVRLLPHARAVSRGRRQELRARVSRQAGSMTRGAGDHTEHYIY